METRKIGAKGYVIIIGIVVTRLSGCGSMNVLNKIDGLALDEVLCKHVDKQVIDVQRCNIMHQPPPCIVFASPTCSLSPP